MKSELFCNNILLSGDWQLAFLKNRNGKDYSSVAEIKKAGISVIPAKVPGNIELDLYAAGLCDDPFFALNPDKVRRQTENLHSY